MMETCRRFANEISEDRSCNGYPGQALSLADGVPCPPTPAGDDATAEQQYQSHPWGIFFTILGTMLLDFDADACQSPSRAYLLDVTVPGTYSWTPTLALLDTKQ